MPNEMWNLLDDDLIAITEDDFKIAYTAMRARTSVQIGKESNVKTT